MSKTGGNFKKRLLSGETLFGTHVALCDFCITEMYGEFGFDYVWIDTEHSAIDYQTLNMHILACQAKGMAAIVRIPFTESYLAKRVLEMGADGIIFPMVNNAETAQLAIDSCLYPPNGKRGFGPARANEYGNIDLSTYLNEVKDELCTFVQIEQKEAVKNLDEILDVPNIDAYIVGPMDLSGSICRLGEIFCDENVELIKTAVSKIKSRGKPIGVSTGAVDIEQLKKWRDLGMQFISAGNDYGFINRGCMETITNLNKAFK